MALEGNMEYAMARVHARHGLRMDEAEWRRVDASRDLGQYLDAIRASALADWIASIDLTQDCHTIERALRVEWRLYVERIAGWHPPESRGWLAWWAWLPMLSLLARLARAEPAPPWMLADPVCGPIAPGSRAERAAALRRTALAPLEPAILGGVPIAAMWRTHWHHLTPPSDAHTRGLLRRFLQAIDAHADRLLATDDAMTLRRELAARLARLFRAAQGTLVATACHLALLALDLERLRGGLAIRCAHPPPAQPASA